MTKSGILADFHVIKHKLGISQRYDIKNILIDLESGNQDAPFDTSKPKKNLTKNIFSEKGPPSAYFWQKKYRTL